MRVKWLEEWKPSRLDSRFGTAAFGRIILLLGSESDLADSCDSSFHRGTCVAERRLGSMWTVVTVHAWVFTILLMGTSLPLPATEQPECLRCGMIAPMGSKISPASVCVTTAAALPPTPHLPEGRIPHRKQDRAMQNHTQSSPALAKILCPKARPPRPVHREGEKGKQRADRKACRVM